jgi:hypothetical protein
MCCAARARRSVVIKVFVSAGTPANESQAAFRDGVLNAIELTGLSPRLMDHKDWDFKNPLRGIRRVMEECYGAVVIAYARYRFETGEELRREGVRSLQDVSFPTAWNQIEAAMAYERDLPLLVVAQKGLRQDAVFESTSDIRPFWVDLKVNVDNTEGFLGYLRSWKRDVEEYASTVDTKRLEQASNEITIRQLVLRQCEDEGLSLRAQRGNLWGDTS